RTHEPHLEGHAVDGSRLQAAELDVDAGAIVGMDHVAALRPDQIAGVSAHQVRKGLVDEEPAAVEIDEGPPDGRVTERGGEAALELLDAPFEPDTFAEVTG